MNKEMFREYDIRGIYGKDIDPNVAFTIGLSFASYIKDKNVIIGRDNRLSSPEIHQNLIKGLMKGGASITDLGLCTTPIYYALKKHLKITNGIMITASHNPKEYNGFKISFDLSGNAYGASIAAFRDYTLNGNFTEGNGSYLMYDKTKEVYLNLVKNAVNLGKRKLKVVFDPGNGTGAIILKDILDMFNIDYKIINGESDGNFPNHHPDPCEPENMVELCNIIKKEGYDLGIGIDGDADRVGVVDNEGNIVPIDKMLIVIYEALFPNLKNKKAIMDVKCSKAVIDKMNALGLPIEVYRTGNSYMNEKINREKLDFGGEFSGHLWFTDKWPGFDDGIYAALRIIEILSNLDKNLSDLTKDIPHYYNTPEIKIPVKDQYKSVVIAKVKEYCIDNDIEFNALDGVRINYPDGFALIRKSNTGPNLTVRFEKRDKEALEKTKEQFISLIEKILLELN